MLRVHTNSGAVAAQSSLMVQTREAQRSIARLSSGLRIQTASDDAAGMAVSTALTARRRSYGQALRNTNEAIEMLQTAESAYQTVSDSIARMLELAVQSSNGALTDTERGYINTEVTQLKGELERVADSVEYNGIPLLGAGGGSTLTFTVGADATDVIQVDLPPMGLGALGLVGMDVDVLADAQSAMDEIEGAMDVLASQRAELGSAIHRMTMVVDGLVRLDENLGAAQNQVRDVDLAAESAELAKRRILMDASVAMLSQANQTQQSVLRLLP